MTPLIRRLPALLGLIALLVGGGLYLVIALGEAVTGDDGENLKWIYKDDNGRVTKWEFTVDGEPLLTYEDIKEIELDKNSGDAIKAAKFRFNKAGALKLEDITAVSRGRYLLITMDGLVLAAPRIRSEISNGELSISGYINADLLGEISRRQLEIDNKPKIAIYITEASPRRSR
jgi:preprotein translocase subunit SecD